MFENEYIYLFQFHKVRLKVFEGKKSQLELLFQFHKVRLKGQGFFWDNFIYQCFNSIRYD